METLLSVATVSDDNKKAAFAPRNPTGRKAEEHFIEFFHQHGLPVSGNLTDTLDLGTGYDFIIANGVGEYFVEVKGISEVSGGILFTDKDVEDCQGKGAALFSGHRFGCKQCTSTQAYQESGRNSEA